MSVIGSGSPGINSKSVSGAPFPAGTADNGLSIDPITGKIVLGADWGDPAGALLSNREIDLDAFTFRMIDNANQEIFSIDGNTGAVFIGDLNGHGGGYGVSTFGEISMLSGNSTIFYSDGNQIALRTNNAPKIVMSNISVNIGDNSNGQPELAISNANDVRIFSPGGVTGLIMDFPTNEFNFGAIFGGNGTFVSVQDIAFVKEILLQADNGIRTSDPGGGILSGAWKLGARKPAAVVFDATQYLEVKVNGTNYKLAIVN